MLFGALTFAMSYDFINWHLLAFLYFWTIGSALGRHRRETFGSPKVMEFLMPPLITECQLSGE